MVYLKLVGRPWRTQPSLEINTGSAVSNRFPHRPHIPPFFASWNHLGNSRSPLRRAVSISQQRRRSISILPKLGSISQRLFLAWTLAVTLAGSCRTVLTWTLAVTLAGCAFMPVLPVVCRAGFPRPFAHFVDSGCCFRASFKTASISSTWERFHSVFS